jgi:hypothetical protein
LRRIAGFVCLSLVTATALGSADARAQDRRSTVLLVDPGSAPITSRLREEIEALGLEVKLVPARDPAEPLDERARAAGAVGAIRLTGGGSGSVDMTILDRATGKTVSRHLAIAMPSDPASAELVATRTVELLRASLMELEAPHPARGDAEVTEQVRAIAVAESESGARAPRSESMLGISTGPALVKSPDFSVGVDLWFTFVLRGKDGLGAMASVLVPAVAEQLDTAEGQIRAFAWQYRLGALFDGPRAATWWSPRFGAGAALVMLTTDGSASMPYVGVSERSTGWGPWASIGLRFELAPQLSAVVAGDATLLVPEMVIRSAGHEVATFGRPLLSLGAGVEVTR